MARENYRTALETLRADVREMGDLVADRLATALRALADGDDGAARRVVDGDDEVNDRYLGLEEDCVDLFALQQPVAGDLRFVTASFKIITDLERVGDLATNLGEYALAETATAPVEPEIGHIGDEAGALLADALDAYEAEDADACQAIAERDDDLDALCQRASEGVIRDLVERSAADDPWDVERVLDDVSVRLLAIRDLERVGDHAVNVAARTLYAVENEAELVY